MFITFTNNLFNNKKSKNAIFGGHFEIDVYQADFVILRSLFFILLKHFLDLFHIAEAIIINRKNLLSVYKNNISQIYHSMFNSIFKTYIKYGKVRLKYMLML